ncbi:hypothetical protein EYR36_002979 [Pleurotus pulmonarius]|nr:hypothetical protein EYR36_002979 [Pleurotus pulmonarius]
MLRYSKSLVPRNTLYIPVQFSSTDKRRAAQLTHSSPLSSLAITLSSLPQRLKARFPFRPSPAQFQRPSLIKLRLQELTINILLPQLTTE